MRARSTSLRRTQSARYLSLCEIGFPNKVGSNTSIAESMVNYYYGLNISTPGYIGGYFWWYYYEDMLPYTGENRRYCVGKQRGEALRHGPLVDQANS
jgi:hypothetical protein